MSEKRHPPTRRRLRDARKKGEVAFSRDVATTGAFIVVLVVLWLGALPMIDALRGLWVQATSGSSFARPDQRVPELLGHASQLLAGGAILVAVCAALGAVAASFFQVGGLMAWERIKPDARRLNPGNGIKRLFSSNNLIGLLKLVVKTLLLGSLVFLVVRSGLEPAQHLGHAQPGTIMEATGRLVITTFAWGAVVYIVMSGADYAHMVYEHLKGLRMSHEELQREHKDNQGDPTHRARRRSAHFEAVYFTLADCVRMSSAVIHSPRVAVALQYLGERDLPRVIARGEGAMAAQIRRAAGEALIPMEFEPALAERLYEEVPLDQPIPRSLYEAVARLLRWAQGHDE